MTVVDGKIGPSASPKTIAEGEALREEGKGFAVEAGWDRFSWTKPLLPWPCLIFQDRGRYELGCLSAVQYRPNAKLA